MSLVVTPNSTSKVVWSFLPQMAIHVFIATICTPILLPSYITLWIIGHILQSSPLTFTILKCFLCSDISQVGGRASLYSHRSSAQSKKSHSPLRSLPSYAPVARLQCWDGVSWAAEVPSGGEGSSRGVNHPAIIVWDALRISYTVTTACKLGWKEAKWPLTSWIVKDESCPEVREVLSLLTVLLRRALNPSVNGTWRSRKSSTKFTFTSLGC